MSGPLSDLTVVEMTAHRAGPFCGALLADMGARVIKIERPGVGDPVRVQGVGPDGKTGYFVALNRNKESVTLDLKSDAGVEAARALLAEADVFVENFGYGVTDRLGIGYDDLNELNPDLVYASVKGYGETGPMREKPGLDLILQAEGGIMSVTGPEDGEPVKVGQAVGDLTAGMFATIGVLARLYERGRVGSGEGRANGGGDGEFVGKLDVGLFDAIVTLLNEYLTNYSLTGEVPGPQGRSHQTLVPYQVFETRTNSIVTGVPSDARWDAFVDVVGCESVREFGTNRERKANAEAVVGAIQDRFEEESAEHWLSALTEAGFPCGPINDVAGVVDHEQTVARELVIEHTDPDAGELLLPGHPINFPGFDDVVRTPAPRLGEHTDEVFSEVAGEQTTLSEWRAGGAFGGE